MAVTWLIANESLTVPEDQSGDSLCGVVVQTCSDVAVRVQRDADIGVPQTLLYNLRVHAGRQCHRRPPVAQVVQADLG